MGLAAAVVLVLAACGSSGSGGSGGGQSAGTPPPSNATGLEGDNANGAITNYLTYVGGKQGKADTSLPPVYIGWVNQQGGAPPSTPEATQGAQAAVQFVNSQLGGVGGHPLALRSCFIGSAEEEGQKCGQQLVADSSVSAIAFGSVAVGNQSFERVLGGQKPLVIGVSGAPADTTAQNTYILYGDQVHILEPFGTYLNQKLHAKTAAMIYPNEAGLSSGAAATKKGLEKAGVKVKAVGYDPNATDMLGPLTAAGAQSADVVFPFPDTPQCASIAKSLTQAGIRKPVVSQPLCLDPKVAQALGDLPKWTYGIASVLPSDASAPDARTYSAVAGRNGLGAGVQNPWAEVAWGTILELAKFMNASGADKISPATMTAQLKAFKGPLILGAPNINCGQFSDAPAVCNNQIRLYTYQGKGAFTPAAGWTKPPSG
jgi:branched-chain amino acid transport system substrate-binding protein